LFGFSLFSHNPKKALFQYRSFPIESGTQRKENLDGKCRRKGRDTREVESLIE
jgi:hypothetical protein